MKASKAGKAKKGARRARKAAPKPGARKGKFGGGTKGAAVAGGAVKPDAERRPVSALQLARANGFTDDIAARRRGRAHALSHGDDEARHGFAPKPPDS